MDNRPISIGTVTASIDSDLVLQIEMQAPFEMPETIGVEFTVNRRAVDYEYTYDIVGQMITITIAESVVKVMTNCLLIVNVGGVLLGKQIQPASGVRVGANSIDKVLVSDNEVVVIQVTDLATSKDLFAQMQDLSNQVSEDADQVAIDTETVNIKADQVTIDSNQVAADKITTEGYKDDAETARDEVVELFAANVTVNTYEDAVPLFTGSVFRRIDVRVDDAYFDGQPSHYTYHPELGVAMLGLVYNYND